MARVSAFSNPVVCILLSFSSAVVVLSAQTQQAPSSGTPWDWSHRHLIFSGTQDPNQAAQLEQEPRYRHQKFHRASQQTATIEPSLSEQLNAAGLTDANGNTPISLSATLSALSAKKKASGLWGESLGSASATVGAANSPAKYSFATTSPTTANCAGGSAPDYVAFNTSVAGSSSQPSIIAFDNLYSGTCTGTVPQIYWSYDTGGTISTSVVLSSDGSQLAFIHTPSSGAASLVILHWHASDGTLTAPKVLTTQTSASNYQICRSSTTAACMYVIAFGDGHNDTMSSPFYDYHDDVLYVGDSSGNLHKFTGVFSGVPTEATTGGWPVTVSSANILLSPVYDSSSKLVFVAANSTDATGSGCLITSGANSGCLYSITTTGTPSVVQSGEIARHTAIFDAPIVDSTAEKVYVFTANDSDSQTTSYCGTVNGNDACAAVWQFGTGFGAGSVGNESTMGITAQPGQAPTMYAGSFDNIFYSGSGNSGNLYVCGFAITGTVPNQTVASRNLYQIPVSTWPHTATNIGAITSASEGCSSVTEIYNPRTFTGGVTRNSATVTDPSGTFTAADVGATITGTDIPTGTTITAVASSTSATMSASASATDASDSITVGDDWIYLSVTAGGNVGGCTGGCIYTYNVAGGPPASVTPLLGLAVAGGSSGITLDNTGTGGGSQIYFSYLTPSAGRTFTGGVTSGSKTVTASTATFTLADVGATISGTSISGTITAVANPTSATMSANASATHSSETITITGTHGIAVQASQSALQ